MNAYSKPLPAIDEHNRPYWEGLKARKVVLPRCKTCGHVRFQPSRYCPDCGSNESEWTELAGSGRIWARCAFHRVYFEGFRDEVPYNVVLVELDGGPRVYSNLVGVDDPWSVPVGASVEAVFDDVTEEVTLLKFRPVG